MNVGVAAAALGLFTGARPAAAQATPAAQTTAPAVCPAGACVAAAGTLSQPAPAPAAGPGSFSPATGFKLADSEYGDLNLKLFTYVRYLNQQGLDESYTDSFGTVKTINPRQDIQFQKVNLQFLGWMMSRRLRYLVYVWTANVSQGLGAQVVVGGNLQYTFNEHLTVGGGIGSMPGTRSLEGNFPQWLSVDNRLIADEFFRPSYTQGIWAKGSVTGGVDYSVMLGNNLSQLGVDAGQLDSGLDAVSASLVWQPVGDYGRSFGDFDAHAEPALRIGVHYTRSDENRQSQPDTEGIENSQIRLSDGNVIFTPRLFGDDISITDAFLRMTAVDAGVKYRGLALEGELFWRWVTDFRGPGTDQLPFGELFDQGFQLQGSAMVVPKTVQAYVTGSRIFGEYGDPWDARFGVNWYPWKNEIVRWNAELLLLRQSPVGALSLPSLVGGNGPVFYSSFMLNF